jgi:radical SAM protein with 4Fe4S-binding SPASM domain
MTTSGYQLDPAKAQLISNYCGAAAVSWYKNDYTFKAIDMLLEAGAKVNLHFVLSKRSINEAIDMIENEKIPRGINRIIFLLFKPVGQGRQEDLLLFDERTRYFLSLIDTPYGMTKIGFDSCCVPGVLNSTKVVDPDCYDACEAARYSAFITSDMKMVPCSFDQEQQWAISLKTHSIQQVWNSSEFDSFRQLQRKACPDCDKRALCLGGCPIKPEITLCQHIQPNQ